MISLPLPTQQMFPATSVSQVAISRVKDVEITLPIVYGTIAFHLGPKATETETHKWTVYIRSPKNEDLGVVIKRVVFNLHKSFPKPVRVVDSPPFELSECGWGEFEIAMSVFFHSDACDKHLDLFHILRLYPQDEAHPPSPKIPVVVETYDEIVFPDPTENFVARVWGHPAVNVPQLPVGLKLHVPVPVGGRKKGDTKDHWLSQWFTHFSDSDELSEIMAARQQVRTELVKQFFLLVYCTSDSCA
ncbi:hypothetical protein Tsubulata_006812 [Turnera subulata]|uniref:YEATS domain-containing protein n=1 Tax=Turnera subulata TaxID=218843 RepID=A0A9Q0FB57_9ROSI|nr:hypothetical protein Tsubulata_006812 [Turnera subulata]